MRSRYSAGRVGSLACRAFTLQTPVTLGDKYTVERAQVKNQAQRQQTRPSLAIGAVPGHLAHQVTADWPLRLLTPFWTWKHPVHPSALLANWTIFPMPRFCPSWFGCDVFSGRSNNLSCKEKPDLSTQLVSNQDQKAVWLHFHIKTLF